MAAQSTMVSSHIYQNMYARGGTGIDLALAGLKIKLKDNSLLAAGHERTRSLEMDNMPISTLFDMAAQSLSGADLHTYELHVPANQHHTTHLHKPNIYSGFLHSTLARLTTGRQLADVAERLLALQLGPQLLEGPLVATPDRLFCTIGRGKKDRDKIILALNFDDQTLQRLNGIVDAIGAVVGVPCQKKIKDVHVIVAKNYGERGQRPDNELLKRLGESIQAMGVTLCWERVQAAAPGDGLGYCVDPRSPILMKCPVKLWQVGPNDDQQLPNKCLWMTGDRAASKFVEIMKTQATPCQTFVQAVHKACAGEAATHTLEEEEAAGLCAAVNLSTQFIPRFNEL